MGAGSPVARDVFGDGFADELAAVVPDADLVEEALDFCFEGRGQAHDDLGLHWVGGWMAVGYRLCYKVSGSG